MVLITVKDATALLNKVRDLPSEEYCAILIDFGRCVALTTDGSLVKHFTPVEQKL